MMGAAGMLEQGIVASWTLAFWTLGHAAMLGWTLAAAIPLIIHWWSRRRFEELPWGAMEFLLAALRKQARRMRLEQLLLLALRMALLAVFALALADPLLALRPGQPGVLPPSQTIYLFVVDTSYSMAARTRDRTCLDAARAAMQQLLDESRDGDGFAVLLSQDPPRSVWRDVHFDRTAVRQAVDRIAVSHGGADLAATVQELERLMEQVRQRHPRVARRRICWFTDRGQTTWEAANRTDVRNALERLGEQAEFALFDLGEEPGPNLAISQLRCDRTLVTLGESARIEAEVQSFGAPSAIPARVEFLVDGRVVQAQDVEVPANGRAVAAISHRFDATGDRSVEARLGVDVLSVDNQRWLVVPVRQSLEVLCIQGEPDAADYVSLALNPTGAAEAPVHAEVAPESALLDRSLDALDCVILNNVARISFDEARRLQAYVARGGGLVVVLGDLVQADNYNRELGETAGDGRLLPAHLEEIMRGGERFLDPRDYRHPLVAPFRGHERAGLLTVPTWRYFQLRPYPSPSVEVALAFDQGDPVVVMETLGRGRTLLVATALSPSSSERTAEGVIPWSALPTWPSFPPLVHGLVRLAVAGREVQRQVMVLQPLEVVTGDTTVTAADVTLPDGLTQRIPCSVWEGVTRGAFTETDRQGIYTVAFSNAATTARRLYAVNVDPRESDLTPAAAHSLPPVLQGRDESQLGPLGVVVPDSLPLFRGLLGAVVVLLLAESSLAYWLARRSG